MLGMIHFYNFARQSTIIFSFMKKFLTLLSFGLLVQASGYAQSAIKAGTVQLGGGINYSHNSEQVQSTSGNTTYTDEYSNNTLVLAPYVGFFVADNLSIGLNLSYAASNQHYTYTPSPPNFNPDSPTTSQLRVGPYVQYYHMLTDQFGLTGTLGAGYEHDYRPGTTNGNSNTLALKSDGFYAGLTPGIVFFPVPKFSVGASVGGLNYSRLSVKPDGANLSNSYKDIASSFGANFGFSQLTFSGAFYFGR
jgi:hypothetical protein